MRKRLAVNLVAAAAAGMVLLIAALVSQLSGEHSAEVIVNIYEPKGTLSPALEKLNSVTAMLQRNNDNVGKAMAGLAKFQLTQAEAVNGGFYYNAFVANLSPAQTLQPFFDYALGFRRGVNAGQPPDNAGPRAEFPLPYNGIPQPNETWGPPPGPP